MGFRADHPSGFERRRLWRSLTAIAVGYALVIQLLVAGLVGSVAAGADPATSGFTLCLNGHADGAPPGDLPLGQSDNCCIFCFAGAHHSLAPSPVATPHLGSQLASVFQPASAWQAPGFARYSVARPRGPPSSA
jgi:hypothetical protein